MSKSTVHMCLSVRGAINWPDSMLQHLCADENGDRLTPAEVRDWLRNELAEGHEVLPMGKPCEGFDYVTGCPGHSASILENAPGPQQENT